MLTLLKDVYIIGIYYYNPHVYQHMVVIFKRYSDLSNCIPCSVDFLNVLDENSI